VREKVTLTSLAIPLLLLASPSSQAADAERASEAVPVLSQQKPEELRATISAVEALRAQLAAQNKRPSNGISNDPARIQRQISMTLNEANLLIALGQGQVLSRPQSRASAPASAPGNELGKARSLLAEMLSDTDLMRSMTIKQQALAFRLQGLAAFYQNDFAGALKGFEASLQKDSLSQDAAWAAFMAAEEHFEESNFARARELYQLVKRLTPVGSKSSELAVFKIAWCAVNLASHSEAEAGFLEIIRKSKDKALIADAVRDLAFVSSKTRTEAQILKLFDSAPECGLTFLKKALSAMESQGKLGARSPLRERVLALETDPAARVILWVESIQGVAKEYASLPHVTRLLEVLKEVSGGAQKLPPQKLEALEMASERVCRIFSETYAGRIQSPEKIGKPVLFATVKQLFSEHLKLFAASKKKSQLNSIWLEACELEKDAECLLEVSERNLGDPALKARAGESKLLGLELLSQGPKGASYRPQFMAALAERLGDPSAKNGAVAGAKLAQLQVQDKQYAQAVQTLSTVVRREPTQEYWYGLKWAQLQTGDYAGVMASPQSLGLQTLSGKPDPRLNSVLSEASLKLATQSKASGDVSKMGAYLQQFEKLSGDPAKVNVARDEWIQTLLEKKSHVEVIKRLAELPPSWHQRSEAGAFKAQLLAAVIEQGQFGLIGNWLLSWPEAQRKGQDEALALLGLLYWGGARSISKDRVRALSEAQRNVWLSSAILSVPEWAFEYFRKYPAQTPTEKTMDLLAHRMTGRVSSDDPAHKKAPSIPLTEFEKSAAKVTFPGVSGPGVSKPIKTPVGQYTRMIQASIEKVKKHRSLMVPALKGQVAEVQLRILSAQRGLEQGASDSITGSPLPTGISGAQLEQYKQGIQQLALEFSDQAKELDSARSRIEEKVQKLKQAREQEERDRTLSPLKDRNGLLTSAPSAGVSRFSQAGNAWGALMELERLQGRKLIAGDDYWRTRCWVLAASPQSPALLSYLYEELSEAGATAVIEAWKAGTGK